MEAEEWPERQKENQETVMSQKDYKEHFKKEGKPSNSTTETPKGGLHPGGDILMMPWWQEGDFTCLP